MRVLIQRVTQASVAIAGETTAAIGAGLLVLVGIEEADEAEDIGWLTGKIARLRVFDDGQGVMNRSVLDTGGDVLVVKSIDRFGRNYEEIIEEWRRITKRCRGVPHAGAGGISDGDIYQHL